MVVVNVTLDGENNQKLPEEDHYEVIKQAGLSMAEVRGNFSWPGYLEVGMIPAATSISRALREHPAKVNKAIMITSVRERGRNRPILLREKEELAARLVAQNVPKEAEASKVVSVGTSSTQVEEEGGGQKDKTHVADDEQEASLKLNTEEEDDCEDSEEEVYNITASQKEILLE